MIKRQARKPIADRVAKVAPARERRTAQAVGSQVCLGVVIGWDAEGPTVDFEGNTRGPVRARLATAGSPGRSAPAAAGREVVLLVDPRPARQPVLLGFLQPPGPAAEAVEARVDGRRVEIEGHDEIVLRCGAASITLRRNGRVVIRGAQIETNAAGLNRIRGGSVSIN